ncbi:DUF3955 domain-containing protein [Clostridium sulfidigenes]|uniref:DUF3955 domain-containing protein n=1 Tax=Clostridium sulfidigenes TaxID=318464 RepID=UPI003F8B6B57
MKKYLFSILLVVASIACFTIFNVVGSEVLPDGTLSEPFFLIPIGFLFAGIAIISAIIIYLVSKFVNSNNQ